MNFKSLIYSTDKKFITILDQKRLPNSECYIDLKNVDDVYDAIKTMELRGAPLIGVAGAYGLVLAGRNNKLADVLAAADYLRKARPTAVNLNWALCRMTDRAKQSRNLYEDLLNEAQCIEQEDKTACQKIGEYGSALITKNARCMVYCNAGALATSGIGTALGIVYTAKVQHKNPVVYVCETRPLLQGARLTTWELTKNDIETYVICDNMIATYLPQVNIILVGADRIALNGDTANKIGTHGLAIMAHHHGVEFYVAAPSSTFDFDIASGTDIPIEIRANEEMSIFNGKRIIANNSRVLNPAFDVTPARLITGIITELGILRTPTRDKIGKLKNAVVGKKRQDKDVLT